MSARHRICPVSVGDMHPEGRIRGFVETGERGYADGCETKPVAGTSDRNGRTG